MRNFVNFVKVAAVGAMTAPLLSHAAVDVSDITAAGADIATVGAAVFSLYVGIKLFKWIRRAL